LRSQLDGGQDPFFEPPSNEDLLTLYFAWLEANRSAQHTDRTKRALQNVLDRMPGVRTAADITSRRIENFKKRRLREVSPHTVNLELRCLRAFLKRCIKQGWLRDVPLQIERVKTPTPGKLTFLKESEIEPFLENLKAWAREGARFILLTGLRLDEARYLEWQDLDLETGELWVRDKPQFGFSPKNARGRVVPLPPDLAMDMKLRERKAGWVLQAERGGQINKRTFRRSLVAAGEKAGLKKRITPHVLRHTYGSRLMVQGVNIQTVRDLMGHSSITTTAIYLHTDPKHRREAVAKLNLPVSKEAEEKVIPLRG
jgi:integrase